jgi:hypothetical protein
MENETRIFFKLVQDEDGYPPVAVESVWTRNLNGCRRKEFLTMKKPLYATADRGYTERSAH